MARFFVDFLKKYFGLGGDEIRITCHLYADHLARQAEIEQHWLQRSAYHESHCASPS